MAPRPPRRPPRPKGNPPPDQMALFDIPADKRSAADKQKYILDYKPSKPRAPQGPPKVAPMAPMKHPRTDKTGSSAPARARALRNMPYDTAMAMQAAKDGDDSDLLPYQPTPSINPPRPRTVAAGYDPVTQTLRVRFRDGAVYGYYDVPPNIWRNFKRVKSPGKAINRTLNFYEYGPEPGL